jgi:phosphoribosylglycinamide formyltransferase-1
MEPKESAMAATPVGVLVSGGGSNLQAILEACATGAIDARVVCVGSDTPTSGGLEKANRSGIPTFVVDYEAFSRHPERIGLPEDADPDRVREWSRRAGTWGADAFAARLAAEAEVLHHLRSHGVKLLALAGFMRLLTPYFIDRMSPDRDRPRIMNIHPALLPAFPGTDGYGDTFRYGCRVAGCTVHFVDYGEDTGPIIGQRCFSIGPEDTLETVRARGLALEWQLYPKCIGLFADGRLRCVRRRQRLPGRDRAERTVVEVLPPG